VSETFGFSEAGTMLSDRERFILHFCCSVVIMDVARPSSKEHRNLLMGKIIDDVIRNRCRTLAPEDVEAIIEEVNEEMVSGAIMIQNMTDEMQWSMTGERTNNNTNWTDMK